jgi:hypothetical protein
VESNDTDAELLNRSVLEPAVFGELYERHGGAERASALPWLLGVQTT